MGTRARRAAVSAAWWSLLVLAFSLYETLGYHWRGMPLTIGPRLLRNALGWGLWLLFLPPVKGLASRWPVRRASDWRRIVGHAAIASAFAVVHSLTIAAVYPLFYYRPSLLAFRDVFRDRMVSSFVLDLFVYAAIVAVTRAAELRARNAEAELRLLYEQLQPHFVFNTLTSAIELVHTDPARAEVVLRDLGALLRRSVECARLPHTTLADEMAFTERYIAIQRLRFPALETELHAEAALLGRRIPRLLLQPLVENAIRNTVGVRGSGRIEVHATSAANQIRIVVHDDGGGGAVASPSTGVGLANVRARLSALYSDRHRLALASCPDGGTTVTIDIPAEAAVV
jgi:signal transduction histidine kinase